MHRVGLQQTLAAHCRILTGFGSMGLGHNRFSVHKVGFQEGVWHL